jgi:DNA polymerase III sliding clamp (beta) subunit (PCNA family)
MNPIALPMAELKPALVGLGKVIAKRMTLPVLTHVRIDRTKAGRIELAVTDLDTAASIQFEAEAQGEPTAFLVPFEDLGNVSKSCGRDGTLIIALVEKDRIAIRFPVGGDTIEHRCETLPVEEFPPIPDIQQRPVTLDENVRRAIHEALQCASTDETRLILNGAYIDVSKSKAHYVVGTDGRHLFSSNSFALPLETSLLIPSHRFLGWKEFQQDGDWSLRVAPPEKDAVLKFEIATKHWRFVSRSIEGNYPHWRVVVPAEGTAKTTIEIDPASTDHVIQTIARLPNHDEVNFAVGLEVADRKCWVLGRSPSAENWSRVQLQDILVTGKEVKIFLNRNLFSKALRFGLNRIEIIDSLSPLRFVNEGRQMVVMPTRPDPIPASPTNPPPDTSEQEATTTTPPPPAEQPENKTTMPEHNGNTSGATRAADTANTASVEEKSALETALGQIEIVRANFRNAIAGLNKLGDQLKAAAREQKANEKEVQSVRQTLRSLQSVRI